MSIKENSIITKKDLRKNWLTWLSICCLSNNWERMQNIDYAVSMAPILKKLYPDDNEKFSERLSSHMEFFNTQPTAGCLINGMVIAMEEEKAMGKDIPDEAITNLKSSMMGPLAGIGDTLRQGTLIPIIGSIAIALGQAGNLFAPIFYMLATLALNWGISHTLFMKVYDKGTAFVAEFFQGNRMEKIMTIITTMGSVTIGALAANTVKLSTPLELTLGEKVLNIQADILDSVILNLLPFCAVMLVFWLIGKKKVSINKVIIGIFVVGIVGGLIGIL